MAHVNVALLQLARSTDLDQTRVRGNEACRMAKGMGADIALLPEMWSCGYSFYDHADPTALSRRAVSRDSAWVRHFQSLARDLDMAIGLTYLEAWPGAPRNSLSVIDRHGDIVLTYAKVHTCEFAIECYLTPGDGFEVAMLDTAQGEVRIGAMICYDREFPESARVLMLKGAEIIFIPNACEMELNRIAQLRSRAMENMTGVALANYAADGRGMNGHSLAFDGIAFGAPKEQGGDGYSRDMLLVEAGEAEGVVVARFDLDALRDYRRRETWGNAYRRPRLYHTLTDETVVPPFVRRDATR